MAPARLALPLLVAAALAPALARTLRRPAPLGAPCAVEGRGAPPRHWLGCAADAGPRRELTGAERLVLGLPLDPNRASAAELAHLPGLSAALARELVAERERAGPFGSVEEVVRVRGIGPVRLAQLRGRLAIGREGASGPEAGAPGSPREGRPRRRAAKRRCRGRTAPARAPGRPRGRAPAP